MANIFNQFGQMQSNLFETEEITSTYSLGDDSGSEQLIDPVEFLKAKAKQNLMHESMNIYADIGVDLPAPAATWWVLDEPSMTISDPNNLLLDTLIDLGLSPVLINNSFARIYEARYEFPKYNTEEPQFTHSDAIFTDNTVGFFDFLMGFPSGCVEKIGIFGEVYSKDRINTFEGGKASSPVPKKFFIEEEGVMIVYNVFWVGYGNVQAFAKGLNGQPEPQSAHWWFRVNWVEDDINVNYAPMPGEFMGIVVYFNPTLPWGWQERHPFVYCGNWIETVYYTSTKVVEVIDETTYLINYHGEEIEAKSSDYAIYNVDDRVTILKGVEHEEDSMTWEDITEYNIYTWSIIPAIFYYEVT